MKAAIVLLPSIFRLQRKPERATHDASSLLCPLLITAVVKRDVRNGEKVALFVYVGLSPSVSRRLATVPQYCLYHTKFAHPNSKCIALYDVPAHTAVHYIHTSCEMNSNFPGGVSSGRFRWARSVPGQLTALQSGFHITAYAPSAVNRS